MMLLIALALYLLTGVSIACIALNDVEVEDKRYLAISFVAIVVMWGWWLVTYREEEE